ncbi:MAG: sensor histidine kinase [bacterium]
MQLFSEKARDAFAIGVAIAIISFLHYSTDIAFAYFHDIYKVLYYIPIILAAFRFGVKGGLMTAILISLVYTPHVTEDWTEHPDVMVNRFVEMIVFISVAFITGKLVEKEHKERDLHKKTAQELRVAYEKLQKHSEYLAEVEEQLRTAERLATLGELTACLAHEVRNPLAAIKGTTEILRDDYPQNGKNQEFFDLLTGDVERIEQVISNYLGQVVSPKKQHEQFETVRATEAVAHILLSKARKDEKALKTDLPMPPLFVKGDEIKFRQIILNFLLNALAATKAGDEILLEMKAKSTSAASPKLTICIKDTGCGIKKSELANIFKPFYTTREDGTGLGLPIAKRIAEEYGWNLSIKSIEGEGTTAKLTLPVLKESNAKTESTSH